MIIKKCIYCKGEIKPANDFFKQKGEKDYEEMKKSFKKEFGFDLPKSENYNCIVCGKVYNKFFKPIKLKLGWLKCQIKTNLKGGKNENN